MTSELCELVKAFAADPRGRAEHVRGQLGEILAHVDACDECETALDEATDAEAIFDVLANEETLLPAAEREAFDRWTTPDTKRKTEVNEAVMELIKGLRPEAARIASKFEPGILHATTEAVSLAIRRSIGRDSATQPRVELHREGAVTIDGREAISAEALAAEIAVFTNQWEDSGGLSSAPVPSRDAQLLARWSFLAVRDQRHLFRHFRAMPPVFGLSFMSDERVVLMPLRREERVDNLYERWRPDSLKGLDTLYIGKQVVVEGHATGRYRFCAVPTTRITARLRDPAALNTLRELGLGRDAEVFLGPPTPSGLVATTLNVPLEPTVFGSLFDSVAFSVQSVELQREPLRPVTLRAERIDLRLDDLRLKEPMGARVARI